MHAWTLGIDMLTYNTEVLMKYVTGFGKTDHNVTIDISINTDLKRY